jgi:hypothetical protein
MASHLTTPKDICSLWGSIASSLPPINSRTNRLLSQGTGVIHVVTAVITAEGEFNMTTSNAEETGTSAAPATSGKPRATKKARIAPQGAHVAKKKGRSAMKATPAKKAPKTADKSNSAHPDNAPREKGVRAGSKTNAILELLKRPGGVTAKELMKVTGWQPHSVRGFLSGTIGKKMGLTVTSTKGEDGERSYSVRA